MPEYGYKKRFELEAFEPDPQDLEKLAQYMTRTGQFFETPKSHDASTRPLRRHFDFKAAESMYEILELLDKDLQDCGIPAGYSYLGQFILHDISFDERTDRFDTTHYPWEPQPATIKNKHNPVLDLETIYGPGGRPESRFFERNSSLLRLGKTLENKGAAPGTRLSGRSFPNDLLRGEDSVRADILDPRNDENLLLAQTQVAFTKFHNAIVYKLGNPPSMDVFERARRMTIRHYQYIILTDFLPRIVQGGRATVDRIISEVKNGTNKFYRPTEEDKFLPLEFVVGAYRTLHSMIRHTYNLNKEVSNQVATLREILLFTGRGSMGGMENRKNLPSRWIVNWKWFYDVDGSSISEKMRFNFARKIDTNLTSALGSLHPGSEIPMANSLTALDLYRARAWRLPTGNDLAREMREEIDPQIKVLTAGQIAGKLGEQPGPGGTPKYQLTPAQQQFFTENTPLLFYLLAEAEIQCEGEALGDVGSRIVGETLVKLICETPDSILQEGQEMESDEDFLLKDPLVLRMLNTEDEKTFGMAEMLKFIAGARKEFAVKAGEEDFDEVNPLG